MISHVSRVRQAASSARRCSARWPRRERCPLRGTASRMPYGMAGLAWNRAWRRLRQDGPRQDNPQAGLVGQAFSLPFCLAVASSASFRQPATRSCLPASSASPTIKMNATQPSISTACKRYGTRTGSTATASLLCCETGRHLALWMSYEDAIRVADLKTRRARFARVRLEARAGDAELLRIHEFLHPRLAEIADILPAALGRRLLDSGLARRIVERFTRTGKVVQTTSIVGFLQLYVLAGLRTWRRKSLRYQRERHQIDQWLALLVTLAGEDYWLAREMAELPRLLKGYGDTHAHGSRNFGAIMNALPELRRRNDAGGRLKKLRDAALADDDGSKLAEVLQE